MVSCALANVSLLQPKGSRGAVQRKTVSPRPPEEG